MNTTAHKILKAVNETGELPLSEAIALGKGRNHDHRDQYPLALLIEDGYLGMTLDLDAQPLEGTEKMREFPTAVQFHQFSLPKDERGNQVYNTPFGKVTSSGTINPERERVFVKTKGSIYLEEMSAKREDRKFAWTLAVVSALLGSVLGGYFTALFTKS